MSPFEFMLWFTVIVMVIGTIGSAITFYMRSDAPFFFFIRVIEASVFMFVGWVVLVLVIVALS